MQLITCSCVYFSHRGSIIPFGALPADEPEYRNLEYGPDGTLLDTTDPTPSSPPHSSHPSQPQGTSDAIGASEIVRPKPTPPSQPHSTSQASEVVTELPPEELKARKRMLVNLIKTHQYENTALEKGERAT